MAFPGYACVMLQMLVWDHLKLPSRTSYFVPYFVPFSLFVHSTCMPYRPCCHPLACQTSRMQSPSLIEVKRHRWDPREVQGCALQDAAEKPTLVSKCSGGQPLRRDSASSKLTIPRSPQPDLKKGALRPILQKNKLLPCGLHSDQSLPVGAKRCQGCFLWVVESTRNARPRTYGRAWRTSRRLCDLCCWLAGL